MGQEKLGTFILYDKNIEAGYTLEYCAHRVANFDSLASVQKFSCPLEPSCLIITPAASIRVNHCHLYLPSLTLADGEK